MVTRIVLAVIGAVLLIAGIAAGSAAVWGYTAVGTEGVVRIPLGTITPEPQTSTTIVDVATFTVSAPYVGALGESELVVTPSTPGTSLFVGAATTPDADAYLAGVPYTVAYREGDAWAVRSVPGGAQPPPTASGRWLTSAEGSAPAISVPEQRPLSLVVVDLPGPGASPFELAVTFTIADAASWLLGMAIAAVVLLAVGGVLLFLALRRRRVGRHAAGQPVVVEEAQSTEEAAGEAAGEDLGETTAEVVASTATDETTELPVVVVADETVADETVADQVAADEVVDGIAYVIEPEDDEHERG